MRASFNNLRLQFKKAPRVSKVLSLAVSLLGLVVLLVLAQTGIQFLSSFAQVAPSVRFDSSSYTLNSSSSTPVRVLVEPGGYQIGFVRVEVVFDTSRVRLANEVIVSSTFRRSLFVSSQQTANSQGKVVIALGLDPSQRTNPPTSAFELAQLFFTPATTNTNQTSSLSFNSAGMQIVNFSYTKLSFTTQGASLTINPTTITSTSTPTPRPTNTPTPRPTLTPTPTPPLPTIPPPSGAGIWISKDEIARLPISGQAGCDSFCASAWNAIVNLADSSWGTPNVSDYAGLGHSQGIWAGAVAYAKFSTMPGREADAQKYYNKVVQGLNSVMGTEEPALPSSGGGKDDGSLAIARQFPRYVLAADLLGIYPWGAGYKGYSNYVDYMLHTKFTFRVGDGGHSLAEQGGKCASNGCAMSQAARTAAAAYLKDQSQLDDAWLTFRRYSGDYTSPATIQFSSSGDAWYHDNNNKLAINPKGATCAGKPYPADGVIPNDQGRGGNCPSDPNSAPGYTQYPWEGLQGAYAAAYMLYRLGYNLNGKNPFQINDAALLRAVQYQWYLQNRFGGSWYDAGRAAWVKHLAFKFYGFKPIQYDASDGGRNMSHTQWLNQ